MGIYIYIVAGYLRLAMFKWYCSPKLQESSSHLYVLRATTVAIPPCITRNMTYIVSVGATKQEIKVYHQKVTEWCRVFFFLRGWWTLLFASVLFNRFCCLLFSNSSRNDGLKGSGLLAVGFRRFDRYGSISSEFFDCITHGHGGEMTSDVASIDCCVPISYWFNLRV